MSESPGPPPLPAQQSKPIGDDVGMRMLLPVGRSGWAIAAGYCGLFAFIGIGAPFALIFGIIALFDIKKSKTTDRPKFGMGRAIFGILTGAIITPLLVLVLFA